MSSTHGHMCSNLLALRGQARAILESYEAGQRRRGGVRRVGVRPCGGGGAVPGWRVASDAVPTFSAQVVEQQHRLLLFCANTPPTPHPLTPSFTATAFAALKVKLAICRGAAACSHRAGELFGVNLNDRRGDARRESVCFRHISPAVPLNEDRLAAPRLRLKRGESVRRMPT